ncbi:D-beta-hydroxybutyrate dehydrogenase, mitochondrial-like [Palaemon carinicauda]|uniref:D-beta-hydroxybutyrate dehydrogenase, mitochondrial-like n=1 Tax=Palaemon carinicauda TaxID=392227 RepID=UPI0035B5C2CC
MKLTVDRTRDILLAGSVSVLLAGLGSFFSLSGFLTTFVVFWIASVTVSFFTSSLKVPPSGKSVLITGCDSGFGFHLALQLHRLGFDVFAGCLLADSRGEGAERLREVRSERLRVLQLDVTSEDQLNEAIHNVKIHLALSGNVLWGLVNNAGLSAFGDTEWVSVGVYRKIADVNLFGVISTTKTFLPLLRRSKGGRIVNVSSMLGRMVHSMGSPYISTKYAVEGFSNCLRLEMRRWGVHVCIIEPGNLLGATGICTEEHLKTQTEEMWVSMSDELKEELGGRQGYDLQVSAAMAFGCLGMKDTTTVTEAMTDALTQKYPRARYLPMEFYNWAFQLIANYLPECVFDSACAQVMRILARWHQTIKHRIPLVTEALSWLVSLWSPETYCDWHLGLLETVRTDIVLVTEIIAHPFGTWRKC